MFIKESYNADILLAHQCYSSPDDSPLNIYGSHRRAGEQNIITVPNFRPAGVTPTTEQPMKMIRPHPLLNRPSISRAVCDSDVADPLPIRASGLCSTAHKDGLALKQKGGVFRPRPTAYLLTDYLALMLIVFGLAFSDFGRVMVRTPFSNSAFARSATTPVGSAMERSNAPQLCSRICQD